MTSKRETVINNYASEIRILYVHKALSRSGRLAGALETERLGNRAKYSSSDLMGSSCIYRRWLQCSQGAAAAGPPGNRWGRSPARTTSNSTPPLTADPRRPSDGGGMGLVKVRKQRVVHKIRPGNPAAVLRSVTHPIYQVLKTPTIASNVHDFIDFPRKVPIPQHLRWRWIVVRRRVRAQDYRLDLGDMEHGVNMQTGGQRKFNRDGVYNTVNGKRANKTWCQLP